MFEKFNTILYKNTCTPPFLGFGAIIGGAQELILGLVHKDHSWWCLVEPIKMWSLVCKANSHIPIQSPYPYIPLPNPLHFGGIPSGLQGLLLGTWSRNHMWPERVNPSGLHARQNVLTLCYFSRLIPILFYYKVICINWGGGRVEARRLSDGGEESPSKEEIQKCPT